VWITAENPDCYFGLKQLGESPVATLALCELVETFVVSLYDSKYVKDINTLRLVMYQLFCQKEAPNDVLPPTKDSLVQHTKRANFQAHQCRNTIQIYVCWIILVHVFVSCISKYSIHFQVLCFMSHAKFVIKLHNLLFLGTAVMFHLLKLLGNEINCMKMGISTKYMSVSHM
jgi:hypothetical protein